MICKEKIAKHGLDMKLVAAEYTFDNNKLLFYFTADGRIDFRELVKDLASVFRTRIELRQVGVRDEAKMLGGIGICGREFMLNLSDNLCRISLPMTGRHNVYNAMAAAACAYALGIRTEAIAGGLSGMKE